MVPYALLITTSSIDLVLAVGFFGVCIYVIVKYLLQMDQKLFVTLHYVFATPLILVDVITYITIYFELPKLEDGTKIQFDDAINLSIYKSMREIHSIFYVGLIL